MITISNIAKSKLIDLIKSGGEGHISCKSLQGFLITEVFNKDINLTSKISNTNNWNINEYK